MESSNFRWTCPFPIREVSELSIIGGSIPAPTTNIDATTNTAWNSFSFRVAASRLTINIPPGLYTPTSLFTTLGGLLDQAAELAGSANRFEVGYAPNTEQLQVTRVAGEDSYGFLFGTGTYTDSLDQATRAVLQIRSPALLLGFVPGRNESDVDGRLIAPNCLDLGLLTNRIYMYLNYDSTQNLQAYTRGLGRPSPSAIIYMDELRDGRKYLNKESYMPFIVNAPTSVARIQSLDVGFQDFFGNPVNFGGREVSLTVEAVCQY